MNKRTNIFPLFPQHGSAGQPSSSQDGFMQLLTTPDIFSMDLVSKNLMMNGIDVVVHVPDPVDEPNTVPVLRVRTEQKEQALSVLASLDLTDFTDINGQ